MKKETKGRKMDHLDLAFVRAGSGCVGCMSAETPFVIFTDGYYEYKWQSENIPDDLYYSKTGLVCISAFVRDAKTEYVLPTLYRVQVHKIY